EHMRRRKLERFLIWKKSIGCESILCARELVPLRPPEEYERHAELAVYHLLRHPHILAHLSDGLLSRGEAVMRLDPIEFPAANERLGRLGLVAPDLAALVYLEGEIARAMHPERIHRIHRGLARGPHRVFLLELVIACFGHPEDFGNETLHVIRLALEVILGNQCREQGGHVAGGFHGLLVHGVHAVHGHDSPWHEDNETFDTVPEVAQLRLLDYS